MMNNYEAPEVFDLGKAKEGILGTKGSPERDPETGEFTYDSSISEIDE